MKYLLIIFILIFYPIVFLSCRKNNSPANSNNPSVNSKMAGIRYWHGFSYTPFDSSFVVDTFGYIVIDNSTIAEQNKTYYGYDTLKLTKTDSIEHTMTYEIQYYRYNYKIVTYNYSNGSMIYVKNSSSTSFGWYGSIVLSTP